MTRDNDGRWLELTNAVDTARQARKPDYPIRQKSAQGKPASPGKFARTCRNCDASFLLLAAGKTGERGIWTQCGHWYCSQECFDGSQS